MKKLLLALGILIGTVFTASAQYWQVVKGHYEYQFFRVDSVLTPPHYSTAARPSASTIQIILNTDSNKMQFSDGTNWHTIADSVVGGGGGGGVIVNVGSAYRLAVIGTSNLKTANAGYAVILDSITTNEITWTVDTTKVIPYTDTLKANGMASKSFVLSQAFVKVSDSATMLAPYLHKADTAAMLANYARSISVVKYTDTTAMLVPYLRKSDTTAMLANYARSINVVKYSDTGTMLSPYARSNLVVKYTDTVTMLANYARAINVVKYSDTSSMLAVYLRKSDTTAMLANYLQSSVAAATYYLASNPSAYIAYSGLSAISGGYLTYNGTGGFGADTTTGKLATQTMISSVAIPSSRIPFGNGTGLTSNANLSYTNSGQQININGDGYFGAANSMVFTLATNIATTPPSTVAIFGADSYRTGATGQSVAYFGSGGLQSLTTGTFIGILGPVALANATTSSRIFGEGYKLFNALTTGSDNIGFGYQAGWKFNTTSNNNIIIGTDSSATNTIVQNFTWIGHGFKDANFRNNAANFGREFQMIVLGNGGLTTTQFTALSLTNVAGDIYFNKDSASYIEYNGSVWVRWGGGSGGGGGNIVSVNTLSNPNLLLTANPGVPGTDFTLSNSGTNTIQFNFPNSSGSARGLLNSTDWTTFNNKQNALVFGNVSEATSSVLAFTGNTGAIIGSGLTIQVKQSTNTQNGYLSSTDWNTFNNKGNGVVTLVSATAPLGVTGPTATPTISLNLAGLPNAYYTNGIHARNDSTAVGGGILDSTLYYHGAQNVIYDSVNSIQINKYPAINTITQGFLGTNNTPATSGNASYGPTFESNGFVFATSSKEAGFRMYNKPQNNGGIIENRMVFETNSNGNPSYGSQGYISDNVSGGRAHFANGDFVSLNLSYQRVSATTSLNSSFAYYTNCTANTFTVTLQPVANVVGTNTEVLVLNSGSGTITVKGNASENITFGASTANTFTLAQGKFAKVHLNAAGTAWYVIENN